MEMDYHQFLGFFYEAKEAVANGDVDYVDPLPLAQPVQGL